MFYLQASFVEQLLYEVVQYNQNLKSFDCSFWSLENIPWFIIPPTSITKSHNSKGRKQSCHFRSGEE